MNAFRRMQAAIRGAKKRQAVADEMLAERVRQIRKFGEQHHLPDGTGGSADQKQSEWARWHCDERFKAGHGEWRHILYEEVAEAFAESDPQRLREELIQVAAVACAWVEAIDARAPKAPRYVRPFSLVFN